MATFEIEGGKPLSGRLRIHGAKNAALPILAASLLASGQHEIDDVPDLLDIQVMLDILKALGAKAERTEQKVLLDTSHICQTTIPEDLMSKMRSSIFLMGPLLAKYGQVIISRPGGCAIGDRPIDLHISGLRSLGAEIIEEQGNIICQAKQLHGAKIHLKYPSVGATENILMAASLAKGKTIISNAAREPEIEDLQHFLNRMGAKITGAGTSLISIEGVETLQPVSYQVIPDRIIAGTLLIGAAMTRGEIELSNCRKDHLESLFTILEASGVEINSHHDIINIKSKEPSRYCNSIKTGPYPDFPTDLQAQLMAFCTTISGLHIIRETVFEGRLKHVDELNKMGANISVDISTAFIRGKTPLSGSRVEATDLRAGASLVLAGLIAEGKTIVSSIHHIDRGYQQIESMLTELGAQVIRK